MYALEITDLKKTYGNGVKALNGISFKVEEGDFYALLGPNGAGKSTTIGVITSLVRKNSGKVEVFGVDTDFDQPRTKSFIGVVPQEFNFNIFETVEQIVLNQAGYYGIPRHRAIESAEEYLKMLDLWGKKDDQAQMLSGGMKRRLMIVRALVHRPKLLILDEPTAGVDIELRRSMWDFLIELNKSGITIILTTHYLEEAENLCRNIGIIDRGEMIENTSVKELLSRMDRQTVVLDLKGPLPAEMNLSDCEYNIVDDHTIEVHLDPNRNMNYLFDNLNRNNIKVASIKNKTNRLEELFVQMVSKENKE